MNLFTFGLYIHAVIVEKCMTFKDIFPGLSRTLSFNFQDFPGPKSFSKTFQVLEFSREKKSKNPGVRSARKRSFEEVKKVKVKEADLYSAFIEVPYTQGAQVRITQHYLQITPYLPLPRKHSPDGASQTEVADI